MRRNEAYLGSGPTELVLARRTVNGTVVTVLAQACRMVILLGSTAVLARLLAPEAFGLVAMVTSVAGLATLLSEAGIPLAVIQQRELDDLQASSMFWVGIAASIVLSALLVGASPLVAAIFSEAQLIPLVMVSSIGCLLAGLGQVHLALLRRAVEMRAVAVIDVGSALVGAGCGIAAALAGLGAWALVVQNLVAVGCATAAAWLACSWRPVVPRRHSPGIGRMLGFSADLTVATFLNYLARNADNVLIGVYAGAGQLGSYSRAYALLMHPLNQINAPISKIAIPLLSRLAADESRYRRAYLTLVRMIALLAMPLVAFMVATAAPLTHLMLGDGWGEAARIYAILGVVGVVQVIANTCGWLFVSQGRSADMRSWSMIGSALTVGSFVIGLPWGAVGVAIAYSATCLLVTIPWLFVLVGRTGPVSTADLFRAVLMPGIVSALVYGAAWLGLRSCPADVPELLWSALFAAAGWTLATAALPEARATVGTAAALLRRHLGPAPTH